MTPFFRLYDLRKVWRALSPRTFQIAFDYLWPRDLWPRDLWPRDLWPRGARLPLPTTLVIDVCNLCNLRCPLCVRGRDEMGRPGAMMTLDAFRRVVDGAPGLQQVNLFDWGEPLLNQAVPEMVRYASARGISTNVHTHFSLDLDDERLRALVCSGLEFLSVSADGFSQPVYERYRVRGDIARVRRNIERVITLRRQLGRATPRLTWQYLETKHNAHETALARAYCERRGVTFFVKDIDTVATVDYPHGEHYESPARWQSPEQQRRPPPALALGDRLPCVHLWFRPVVHADLKVAPCCYVSRSESDLGDLAEVSLEAIWNGESYRYARALFTRAVEVPRPPGGVVCERCVVVARYRARRGWL